MQGINGKPCHVFNLLQEKNNKYENIAESAIYLKKRHIACATTCRNTSAKFEHH